MLWNCFLFLILMSRILMSPVYDYPLKNDNLGLKMKLWNFLGIQPSYGGKSVLMWYTVIFVYPNGSETTRIPEH